MFNKIIVAGHLTADPEKIQTRTGTTLVKARLGCNRHFKDREGNKRKEVCFIDVVFWGSAGETVHQYLHKGEPVLVEGVLQQSTWETPGGEKRSRHQIRADRFTFLPSSRRNGESRREDRGEGYHPDPEEGAGMVLEEEASRMEEAPF